MKRLALLLLLCATVLVVGQTAYIGNLYVGSGYTPPEPEPAAPGSCTNLANSITTSTDAIGWGNEPDSIEMASKISVPTTTNVCTLDLYLDKVGTPADTLKVGLFAYDAGNDIPGVQIGDYSTGWAAPTGGGWYSFTNLSWSMTGGSNYCVVVGRVSYSTLDYYGQALGDGDGVWANRSGGWAIYYSRTTKSFLYRLYTQ